jgi:hypothetical protein
MRIPTMKATRLKKSGSINFVGKFLAIVLLGVFGVPFAAAGGTCGSDAWSVPSSGVNKDNNINGFYTANLGNVFTANISGTVCALGIYQGNDYTGSEWVGLYDSSSDLLTSTSVSANDSLYDGYYWNSTDPATVIAGDTYTVVVFTGYDVWGNGPAPINNWGTFTGTVGDFNSTPDLPSSEDDDLPGPAYYGGNAMIGGGETPEPGSLLLFGSGLLGLAGVLRRKLRRD